MFSVGSVLATTFRIWFRRLPRFVLLALVAYVPIVGCSLLHYSDAFSNFMMEHVYTPLMKIHPVLVGTASSGEWIVLAILKGAIAVYVVARVRGDHIGIFRGLGRSLRRSGSLVSVALVERIATTGISLAVVAVMWDRERWMWGPGPYLWVVWGTLWIVLTSLFFIVWPVAAIEKRGPLSTIRRNFTLTAGNRFKVLAIVLVLWAFEACIHYVLDVLLISYRDAGSIERQFIILAWARLAIEIVFGTLIAVAIGVTYERLREAKEGPTPDELHRVFD